MSELREKMVHDLQLAGLAEGTKQAYVRSIFAWRSGRGDHRQHFNKTTFEPGHDTWKPAESVQQGSANTLRR